MFHIHKWDKWAKPFARKVVWVDGWKGTIVHESENIEYWQKRVCLKCGKEQWRQVD